MAGPLFSVFCDSDGISGDSILRFGVVVFGLSIGRFEDIWANGAAGLLSLLHGSSNTL